MKKILLAMAGVGALAAVPAAAQSTYQGQYDYRNNSQYGYQDDWNGSAGFNTRLNQTELRIQDGISARTIDRREAMRLRAQLRDIRRLEARYSYSGGISQQERMDLQQRLRSLRQDVRIADGRVGRDDRYGFDDRYDNPVTGSGYYGQGGPYEDACVSRGGLAGVVDNLVGTGCLRVGQRATTSLGAVPYQYRDRYRDGAGVYYRSDGRSIYRIDTRTNTVLDVYGMDR